MNVHKVTMVSWQRPSPVVSHGEGEGLSRIKLIPRKCFGKIRKDWISVPLFEPLKQSLPAAIIFFLICIYF